MVALYAEGVGRNSAATASEAAINASPSTRRAWVEIFPALPVYLVPQQSPSTRRAWVEISVSASTFTMIDVALYAEGVGRNKDWFPRMCEYGVALYAEGVGRNISS